VTRSVLTLGAIFLGIVLPFGHAYVFLIRYFLMFMLFMAFIDIRLKWTSLSFKHLYILGLNILSPLIIFYALDYFNGHVALALFAAAITPTAIVAPVITSYLKKEVAFVALSVIITNAAVALLVPFMIPLVSGDNEVSTREVIVPVLVTFAIPLAAAFLVQRIHPAKKALLRVSPVSFVFFLGNVYLASAKATDFITGQENVKLSILIYIAVLTGILCIGNFKLGHLVGKPDFPSETAQSLGQKNTTFTIWIALTYINPIAALGPMFYILFHNSYNSYQLYRMRHPQPD